MTKQYTVIIPVAGHVTVSVEADDKDDARDKAYNLDLGDPHIANLSWDTLDRFNQGNVCYCPEPWEVEVIEE